MRLLLNRCTTNTMEASAIAELPDDLLACIFSLLHTQDRFSAQLRCCKRWRAVLDGHPICWQRIEMWKPMPLTPMLHSITAQWKRSTPPPIKHITLKPPPPCPECLTQSAVCSRPDIMDITPLLRCTQLTTAVFDSPPCLSAISLMSKLPALTSLTICGNKSHLTSALDLSRFCHLRSLFIIGLEMTALYLPTTLHKLNLSSVVLKEGLDVSCLANLVRLRTLWCTITTIVGLEQLTRLEDISLFQRDSTDIHLPTNPFPNMCSLKRVSLSSQPALSAFILEHIAKMPHISEVKLSLRADDMRLLVNMRGVPSSCRLTVTLESDHATDQSFVNILHAADHLVSLSINSGFLIGNARVSAFSSFHKLEELAMNHVFPVWQALAESAHSLREVLCYLHRGDDVSSCFAGISALRSTRINFLGIFATDDPCLLPDDIAAEISSLRSLRELYIPCPDTKTGFASVCSLPSLRQLWVINSSCRLSGDWMSCLVNHPALETLCLRHVNRVAGDVGVGVQYFVTMPRLRFVRMAVDGGLNEEELRLLEAANIAYASTV